eukprot:jgi/Botrbrau1/23316/Bobra.0102s0053.1
MQIFVRTDKTHTLSFDDNATVADVKTRVFGLEGTSIEEQRVLFQSKQLEDGVKLSDAGIGDEDTLYILLRLLGGAKKRKKKTYTKPKKQKHKHKKVKLAVLKYYKVDDSGKVTRLKKTCPTCGPGIFMATMYDRVYCGQCHVTYMYEDK